MAFNSAFGNNTQPSTGLFGSGAQSTTTAAFGQSSTTGFGQSTAPAFGQSASQPGLFGSKPAATTPGFGFGSQPAANNTFGTTTATPSTGFGATLASTTTTGFGSNSLFGNQQKPAASTFGTTTNTFQSQPAGGMATTSLFGQSNQQQPLNQSQFPQAQNQLPFEPHLAEYIQYLGGCWDLNNQLCQFKHYFYNMVHPSEVSLYGPQPGEDQVLYEQACQDNPDPTCLVPVLATGFSGLKTRLATQEEQLKTHKEKLQVIIFY